MTINQLAILDWQQMQNLMNGNLHETRRLFKQFLGYLPQALLDIQQSAHSHNFQVLLHHAHKLHSACCYCGVPALKEAAKNLEKALRKHQELETIPLVLEVERQVKLLLEAIAKDQLFLQ